jgi:hypothetical protein
MDIKETKWGSVDWIHLPQDTDKWLALVNTVMSLNVPYNAENFSNDCGTTAF